MSELITAECNVWIIYDSNDNNKVIGMLDESADKTVHDSLNPSNIRTSTNTISSPDGDVLYLEQISVDSNGLAARI